MQTLYKVEFLQLVWNKESKNIADAESKNWKELSVWEALLSPVFLHCPLRGLCTLTHTLGLAPGGKSGWNYPQLSVIFFSLGLCLIQLPKQKTVLRALPQDSINSAFQHHKSCQEKTSVDQSAPNPIKKATWG